MEHMPAARLPGRFGVWAVSFRATDTGLVREAASELDELG